MHSWVCKVEHEKGGINSSRRMSTPTTSAHIRQRGMGREQMLAGHAQLFARSTESFGAVSFLIVGIEPRIRTPDAFGRCKKHLRSMNTGGSRTRARIPLSGAASPKIGDLQERL